MGTFSARYAYLATWDIGALFDELAGHHVNLPSIRQEFRQLLLAHQLPVNESLLQMMQSGAVTGPWLPQLDVDLVCGSAI